MQTRENYLDRVVLSTIRLRLYGAFVGVALLLMGVFLSAYTWSYPDPFLAIFANVLMWVGGLLAVGSMLLLVLFLCLWPAIRNAVGGR